MQQGLYNINIGGEDFATTDNGVLCQGSEGGPQVETVPMFGAAAPKYLELGNTAVARRYTITKEHADTATAVAFEHDAPAQWSGVSDVVITHQSGPALRWLAAKVDVAIVKRNGVTTTVQLTVTGPASEIPPT